MAVRERLNHVAAGIAGAFISRNNDFEGYWAPGLIYREAATSLNLVELDLLLAQARPAGPFCAQAACRYAAFMRRALAKLGLEESDLRHASLQVQFDTQVTTRPLSPWEYGELFDVTVHLQMGRWEGRAARTSRCLAIDSPAFSHGQMHGDFRRSTRWPP